jgi:hypothetical protein
LRNLECLLPRGLIVNDPVAASLFETFDPCNFSIDLFFVPYSGINRMVLLE